MSEAYTETVLDHFRNPRNVGVQTDADAVGRAENPASGASMELYLRVLDGRIHRATFQIQGCTASVTVDSSRGGSIGVSRQRQVMRSVR